MRKRYYKESGAKRAEGLNNDARGASENYSQRISLEHRCDAHERRRGEGGGRKRGGRREKEVARKKQQFFPFFFPVSPPSLEPRPLPLFVFTLGVPRGMR